MINLIKNKDFSTLGKVAQRNCLLMHSCMMTTDPAIVYWEPGTIEVMRTILEMQEHEKQAYFTMDAGPQTKIICLEKDVPEIKAELEKIDAVQEIYVCKPGDGPRLIEEHLF
jgi:diphosphomevalonate decarboxylase